MFSKKFKGIIILNTFAASTIANAAVDVIATKSVVSNSNKTSESLISMLGTRLCKPFSVLVVLNSWPF